MRISDWSSDVCSSDLAKTIIKLIERLRPLGLPGSRVAEWAANLHQAAQEIYASGSMAKLEAAISDRRRRIEEVKLSGEGVAIRTLHGASSEARRVGKACVSTCRSRWSPYN